MYYRFVFSFASVLFMSPVDLLLTALHLMGFKERLLIRRSKSQSIGMPEIRRAKRSCTAN